MPRFRHSGLILICGLAWLVGCDRFDKEEAAVQIRDRFCEGWPYGCTERTEVSIEDVNKTRSGRQVVFRVRDRDDETAKLSAAYFEPGEDDWMFLLFEPPFRERFQAQAARVGQDSRALSDHLSDLKRAQRWYHTIYGRYAGSLSELDAVSYKPPDLPIEMGVSSGNWHAEMRTEYVKCEFDSARMQLPSCSGLAASDAGSESGPLSRAFGEAG